MAATKKKTLSRLAIDKLSESSLDLKDAKHLGIELLTAAKTKQLFSKQAVPSLKLNYFDANGKKRNDVYRVRLLGPPQPGAFGEIPDKPLRYLQLPDSAPAAYFPKSIKWSQILKDPETTIYITEGELKAACACKFGFPTIGLGGVFSWRSAKLGISILPELAQINWSERDVVIVFDSDAATNPAVANATAMFLNELAHRGAQPRVAQLPAVPELEKTGLDDYITVAGPEAFEAVIDEAECDDLATQLWKFNKRFGFVLNPGMVYDDTKQIFYAPDKFQNYLFANVWADKLMASGDGTKIKRVKVAHEWIDWPLRRQYHDLTYQPGAPSVVNDHTLNVWPGWAVEPKKGSITPWKELLNHLFHKAEPGEREWFEHWCFYPMANPGIKMMSAACLWSRPQGVGKSLVGFTLGRVYGDNYSLISQRELESDFNGWAVRKQFVLVDDVSSHDSRGKADILKKEITQENVQINVKYLPTYSVPDCINYYLTSNRSNAFYVEEQDRRYFVHEVRLGKLPAVFYTKYHEWLNSDGPSALLHHAQTRDYGDFSPYLSPPTTRDKQEMINNTKSELDLWLTELREEPHGKLKLGQMELTRDLWTPRELMEFFETDRHGRPCAVNTMGLRLREYFQPAADGGTIKPNGKSERFYIIRNESKWLRANRDALKKHIQQHRAKEQGSGKKY